MLYQVEAEIRDPSLNLRRMTIHTPELMSEKYIKKTFLQKARNVARLQ